MSGYERRTVVDDSAQRHGAGWTRIGIDRIEDLSDAVYGAGLEAMQMSRAPVTGSLAFAEYDGAVVSSGHIRGRVALRGPLSENQTTFGVGLEIAPGSLHWMNEVATGDFGIFMPGDEHDALYAPGSLYAAITLTPERLESAAERVGLVLDRNQVSGTGIYPRQVSEKRLQGLRAGFACVHAGRRELPSHLPVLGDHLLEAVLSHLGRPPHPSVGRSEPRGNGRIVARARTHIFDHLDEPLSIDAIAAAAFTSRRTLHRAFKDILDETPQSYVRKLRLHRIRHHLASGAEFDCTVTLAANRCGVSEFGRLSGWYRELFGELPSETLARRTAANPRSPNGRVCELARSA